MDNPTRRYFRQFIYSMIAYLITLAITLLALGPLADYPLNLPRIVAALAPFVPIIFMIRSFLKYLGSIDELQQRIQLLAIGFASVTMSLFSFSYGILDELGFPSLSPLWYFPAMILLWAFGLIFISRRYK